MIWIKAISLFCTYFTINHVALISISRSYCQAHAVTQVTPLSTNSNLPITTIEKPCVSGKARAFIVCYILNDLFTQISYDEQM